MMSRRFVSRSSVLISSLVLIFSSVATFSQQSVFMPTGSTNPPQEFDSKSATVLLQDGRVLVVGGAGLAGAQMYDPVSGTWSPTGFMACARDEFSATLLSDGRVLAVGGSVGPNQTTASAEIFDPASGLWTPAAPLSQGRMYHLAVLLSDGHVLVAGGIGPSCSEIYDPAANTWTLAGNVKTARNMDNFNGVLLPNGKVLAAGGTHTSQCELFDPSTGNWEYTGSMIVNRNDAFRLIHLSTGRILAAGGQEFYSAAAFNQADLYDPATGLWSATAPMPVSRFGSATAALPDGRILFAGGALRPDILAITATSVIYDPQSATWTSGPDMAYSRFQAAGVSLQNGTVLVVGGMDPNAQLLSSCELYVERCTPTADAGLGQTVHPGTCVTLDGSASSDPCGYYPLTYAWTITAKPDGSAAELDNSNAVDPSFVADMPGEYTVTLVVTNSLHIASQSSVVQVSTENSAPIAEAGLDQEVTALGETVTLNGSQSYDPDGDNITYEWILASKPDESSAVLANNTSATPSLVPDVYGEYLLSLVVHDPWSASVADQVLVSFSNIKPVAVAGVNQSCIAGENVQLDGNASSDPNGDVITFSWSIVSTPEGSTAQLSSTTVANPILTTDLAGAYVVGLVVNDGSLNSDPSTVSIASISRANATTQTVQDAIEIISNLAASSLVNPNLANALTQKLNSVLLKIDTGLYADAYNKLKNDLLKKCDGCAVTGAPDNNDFIKDCVAQAEVHALILQALEYLQGL